MRAVLPRIQNIHVTVFVGLPIFLGIILSCLIMANIAVRECTGECTLHNVQPRTVTRRDTATTMRESLSLSPTFRRYSPLVTSPGRAEREACFFWGLLCGTYLHDGLFKKLVNTIKIRQHISIVDKGLNASTASCSSLLRSSVAAQLDSHALA
jgi:hypothetical protein